MLAAAAHEKEGTSRLVELLACEEELAGLMADARAEGRRRVEAAREEAERVAAELGSRLEQEADRARREIAEAAGARVEALLEEARFRAARFDDVSDEQVARLAESALRRLMGTVRG